MMMDEAEAYYLSEQREKHEKLQRKYEALVDGLKALLVSAQQTPLAPAGVTHVWADDLKSLLEELNDE